MGVVVRVAQIFWSIPVGYLGKIKSNWEPKPRWVTPEGLGPFEWQRLELAQGYKQSS